MSLFTIRPARPADAATISELVCTLSDSLLVDPTGEQAQEFFSVMQPARVAINLGKQDRFYLVAELNEQVIGMILVLNNNYIGQFFVGRPHQRNGVGSALWAAALTRAKLAGGNGAFTVKSSISAVPLYERFGFSATAAETVVAGFRSIPMQREACPSAA